MQNCKKICGVEIFNLEISMFFNLSKNYSAEFFLIFPVFSSKCDKKILIKKNIGSPP